MKNIGLIASLFLMFQAIGQKSYYFSEPLSPVSVELKTLPENLNGTYSSNEISRMYEVSENGIAIVSTVMQSMSRDEIRESSKYDVRGGLIFGVVEGDSIPCVLEDERYYFGVRNRDILIGESSMNVLTKVNSTTFLVNLFAYNAYIPFLMEFKGSKLTIKYFDYESDTEMFDFITNHKVGNLTSEEMIVLEPNLAETEKLLQLVIFDAPIVLRKQAK